MPYEKLELSTETPVYSWANHPLSNDENKMAQNVASLPFVFKHVALMPDVHFGKGALVGSVIATKEAIIPAAVGVDIGCGMAAIKMPFKGKKLEGKLKKIRLDIEAAIPTGFNENKEIEKVVTNWQGWRDFNNLHSRVQDRETKALRQMGSLGGGNHFIEVCLDANDQVWLMLHSGSRGIGNLLADSHITTAKNLAIMAENNLPDPNLAHFITGTPEFQAYWHDLQWAQEYAKMNRDVMMARFKKIIEQHLGGGKITKPLIEVNCHHNYAEKEVHFGEEIYVTRKGAVRAQENDYGIIPGSMGTKSYIVKGKGCAQSFCSCSHGAGRLMSRSKAKNTYTLDDLIKQTEGIECRKDEEIIDEIPAAYKPIDEVMESQSDLVEVVATLKQVVCVKGA
jgi:tRNA-splicing ligase RtcB (3'-phosphate/5'-hydroxy nucleic acid ligase)